MSRIVVVGAHGRTGLLIVKALQKAGDTVVATVRNPHHMAEMVRLGAETSVIDLERSSYGDWVHVFAGADAVVFAAGSADGESSAIDRKGVQRTLRAAARAKVPRYVAISALGSSTEVPAEFLNPEMKDYFAAKRTANKLVRNSSLFWTILEPGELTEGKPTGKLTISTGKDIANRRLSRADLATAVLAVLAEPKTAGHTFQLIGGSTPIAAALKAALAD